MFYHQQSVLVDISNKISSMGSVASILKQREKFFQGRNFRKGIRFKQFYLLFFLNHFLQIKLCLKYRWELVRSSLMCEYTLYQIKLRRHFFSSGIWRKLPDLLEWNNTNNLLMLQNSWSPERCVTGLKMSGKVPNWNAIKNITCI